MLYFCGIIWNRRSEDTNISKASCDIVRYHLLQIKDIGIIWKKEGPSTNLSRVSYGIVRSHLLTKQKNTRHKIRNKTKSSVVDRSTGLSKEVVLDARDRLLAHFLQKLDNASRYLWKNQIYMSQMLYAQVKKR